VTGDELEALLKEPEVRAALRIPDPVGGRG
jgi:hypothetical protein